eukprot:2670375-Amphidinium_carterae.1
MSAVSINASATSVRHSCRASSHAILTPASACVPHTAHAQDPRQELTCQKNFICIFQHCGMNRGSASKSTKNISTAHPRLRLTCRANDNRHPPLTPRLACKKKEKPKQWHISLAFGVAPACAFPLISQG